MVFGQLLVGQNLPGQMCVMGIVVVNNDAVQESRCMAGCHSLGELRGGGVGTLGCVSSKPI